MTPVATGNKPPAPAGERRMGALLECMPFAVAQFDRGERFLYVNDAFEHLTGIRREQVLGKTVAEAELSGEMTDHLHGRILKVFATGDEEISETRWGELYFRCRFVPQHSGGTVGSVVLYADDITDRRNYREQLRESLEKLRSTMLGVVSMVSRIEEMRDPYTVGHQRHVSQLASAIAREMGLPEAQVEGIRVGGLVHDIGKLDVPTEILTKPGRLSRAEFTVIKIHPTAGYELLKLVDFPWPVAEIAHQHQERIDGTGYPRGLKQDEILLEARIITVADVVEAMTFPRPYRPMIGLEKALHDIMNGRDLLYYAPAVDACLRLFRENRFHFTQPGGIGS